MYKKQSKVIELLRFPLIILVVFIHSLSVDSKELYMNVKPENVYNIVTQLISHHIGRIAVPCFFMFSGYFLYIKLINWNLNFYLYQLRKRFNTIILPYVIWNVLFVIIIYFKNIFFYKAGFNYDDNFIRLKNLSFYDVFWEIPINYPLWYIRDLIVMLIISPLFFYYFKYTRYFGLIPLLLIYLLNIESNIPGFSTAAFMFFGFGAFMGLYKKNILEFAISLNKLIYTMTILTLLITTYLTNSQYYEYSVRFFTVFGVLCTLLIGYKIYEYKRIRNKIIRLAPTVFFIYASHVIYILNWIKGGFMKLSFHNSYVIKLISYFIIPILCVLILILIYKILSKYLPNVLKTLIGNR